MQHPSKKKPEEKVLNFMGISYCTVKSGPSRVSLVDSGLLSLALPFCISLSLFRLKHLMNLSAVAIACVADEVEVEVRYDSWFHFQLETFSQNSALCQPAGIHCRFKFMYVCPSLSSFSPFGFYYHLMCSVQSNVNGFVYIVSFRKKKAFQRGVYALVESSMSPDTRQLAWNSFENLSK